MNRRKLKGSDGESGVPARMPLGGRVVPEFGLKDIREVIRRTYRIVYRVRGNDIVVLTIFDGRRLLANAISEK